MKKQKIFFLLTSFIFIFLFVTSQSNEKKNALNGRTFTIKLTNTIGDRKGWAWATDELSFDSDQLISKVMSEHEHFSPASFTITVDSSSPETTVFEATGSNPGGSEIKWQGTV